MAGMVWGIELAARILFYEAFRLGLVAALGAQRIALGFQAGIVRPMTVETCHARPSHFALLKRAVFEDLVEDLSVGEIKVLPQQGGREVVEIGFPG